MFTHFHPVFVTFVAFSCSFSVNHFSPGHNSQCEEIKENQKKETSWCSAISLSFFPYFVASRSFWNVCPKMRPGISSVHFRRWSRSFWNSKMRPNQFRLEADPGFGFWFRGTRSENQKSENWRERFVPFLPRKRRCPPARSGSAFQPNCSFVPVSLFCGMEKLKLLRFTFFPGYQFLFVTDTALLRLSANQSQPLNSQKLQRPCFHFELTWNLFPSDKFMTFGYKKSLDSAKVW